MITHNSQKSIKIRQLPLNLDHFVLEFVAGIVVAYNAQNYLNHHSYFDYFGCGPHQLTR